MIRLLAIKDENIAEFNEKMQSVFDKFEFVPVIAVETTPPNDFVLLANPKPPKAEEQEQTIEEEVKQEFPDQCQVAIGCVECPCE